MCWLGFTAASGNHDAWLVKLDSHGYDSLDSADFLGLYDPPISKEEILLFPNPAKEIL